MQPQYSSYTSFSTDGSNIYTSVVVDGYTSGTCEAGSGACSGFQHEGQAYNLIGSNGGWGYGPYVIWNGYISYENDQSLAATDGTEYTFQAQGQVACNCLGTIYSSGLLDQYITLKTTFGKWTGNATPIDGEIDCEMAAACTNGTPACRYPKWQYVGPATAGCPAYAVGDFVAVRPSQSYPWSCFLGPSSWTDGPGECSPP